MPDTHTRRRNLPTWDDFEIFIWCNDTIPKPQSINPPPGRGFPLAFFRPPPQFFPLPPTRSNDMPCAPTDARQSRLLLCRGKFASPFFFCRHTFANHVPVTLAYRFGMVSIRNVLLLTCLWAAVWCGRRGLRLDSPPTARCAKLWRYGCEGLKKISTTPCHCSLLGHFARRPGSLFCVVCRSSLVH